MALTGDFKSISLVSLLQIIEAEKKTGTLSVSTHPFKKHVFFNEGSIVFMVSDEPRDFLGHFLVQRGLISEGTLAQAVKKQMQTKELLGKIIKSITQLTEEKLRDQLRKKLEETIYQLFLIEEAQFVLNEEEIEMEKFPEHFQLNIRNLLLEGMHRVDEFKKLKKLFPDDNQTFLVNREKIGGELSAKGLVPNILDRLERGLSVRDLCLHFHSYEYSVLRYLEPLMSRNIIAPGKIASIEDEPAQGVSEKDLLQNAKVAEDNEDWGAASEIYRKLLRTKPKDEKVLSKFKGAQEKIVKKAVNKNLAREVVLHLNDSFNFDSQHLSPLEGFVISRVNGNWTVGEIISIVPSPEAEVFQCLNKLLARGIIKVP